MSIELLPLVTAVAATFPENVAAVNRLVADAVTRRVVVVVATEPAEAVPDVNQVELA